MQPKQKLILILAIISAVSIIASMLYYRTDNQKVDPRTLHARELYKQYDEYARKSDYNGIFRCLDSIETIYSAIPFYQQYSFEIAVTQNNRAAALLTLYLFKDSLPESYVPPAYWVMNNERMLELAMEEIQKSLHTYEAWKVSFANLSGQEIRLKVEKDFIKGLEDYSQAKLDKFLEKKVEEMQEAQIEIDRRISVALTNYGVCLRHQEKYVEAAEYYVKAMEYWEDNLQAKNNLNVLLNQPMEKQNIIQKLFPKERVDKKEQ